MREALNETASIFVRGGPVMWPLLALSILSVALTIERSFYWFRQHRPGRRLWLERLTEAFRDGDAGHARRLLRASRSMYAKVASNLLERPVGQATAVELVETHRAQIERFGATQATIIAASPLLGILGTVLGIIESFDLLGTSQAVTDIGAVSGGIAEALITTAFGLVVALLTLFPHMVFRAQAERAIGAIELLTAAALGGGIKKQSSIPAKAGS